MLNLSRRIGEAIFIDVPPSDRPQRIVMIVCGIGRGQCKLAFDAAREVRILRDEVIPIEERGKAS